MRNSRTWEPDTWPAGDVRGAAQQSSLRTSNLAAVTRAVVAAEPPLSRAGIAAALHTTRSTAARLVDELVDAGVLVEQAVPNPSGRGRPATPLVASPRLAALGLQVNTTFLVARLVNLRGEVVVERRVEGDFRPGGPHRVLGRLDRLATQVLEAAGADVDLVGTGLALPGLVDARVGRLLVAPNLGWRDVLPSDHLGASRRTGGLLLGNEADLAARAIADRGPGRPGPLRDFIFLSGETGIGGAAVLDGQLMTGRHGWAGEIGHVCVDPNGPPCRCGSHGCLELYAGRRAILEAAGAGDDLTTSDLVRLTGQGHRRALRAVERAAAALATALVSAINVLDINVVVLGGHLGQISEVLRPRLEHELEQRVLSARWVTPQVVAQIDDDGLAATGAAFALLARVVDDPASWISTRSAPN